MELKIQSVGFSPRFNINKTLTKPYLAPSAFDTVELSFGKKKKKNEIELLLEKFQKKKVKQKEINRLIKDSDTKSRFLQLYRGLQDGSLKFSRTLRENEIALIVNSKINPIQIQRFIDLTDNKANFSRRLNKREVVFAIREGLCDSQVQRFIEIKDGKTDISKDFDLDGLKLVISENLDDEQIQKFINVRQRTDKRRITGYEIVKIIKSGLSEDAINVYLSSSNDSYSYHPKKQQLFSDRECIDIFEALSSPDSKFNGQISPPAILHFAANKTCDEDIAEYIDYKNQKLECGKNAGLFISQNSWLSAYDTYKTISIKNLNYFAKYLEEYEKDCPGTNRFRFFLDDFQDEKKLPEKIDYYTKPNKNGTYNFSRPLSVSQAFIAIKENYTNEQTERLLTLTGEKSAKDKGFKTAVDNYTAGELIKYNADDEDVRKIINAITCDEGIYYRYDIERLCDILKSVKEIKNIKDIENVPKNEARKLLKEALKFNAYVDRRNSFISSSKILDALEPEFVDKYSETISKLTSKIGFQDKILTDDEQRQCLNGIKNLQKSIKSVDLNNCEIKVEETGYVSVSGYPEFEADLNDILVGLPEFKNTIGKCQQGEHIYTVDKHMLKTLQNIVNDPEFEKLDDSDKKVLTITGLMHDLSKKEGAKDREHAENSAFDVYYILQRLNLENFEKIKIYNLIKSHHWLEIINKANDKEKAIQDVAFDLRSDNEFEMSKILCRADLGAVRCDNSFYLDFKELYDDISSKIKDKVNEIRKTQIFMPQTKIPKASEIKNGKIMEADGIKNTVLIAENLSKDLSPYGFEEGCTKENFRTFLHGFDSQSAMINFNAFNIIDSDAILSTSYIDSKSYRVFKQYGFLVDVEHSNIHVGLPYDFGTGRKKDMEFIKNCMIFKRASAAYVRAFENSREYMSDLIKEKASLTDEEYIEKIKNLKGCKSYSDIEKKDPEFAKILNNAFYDMELRKRSHDRYYNEFLCSNPTVKAIYSYDKKYEEIPLFLRKYAADNDLPIIMFGEH